MALTADIRGDIRIPSSYASLRQATAMATNNKQVAQITDGIFEMKEATLYTAFRRLEGAGLIRAYWGDEQSGAAAAVLCLDRKRTGTAASGLPGMAGNPTAAGQAAGTMTHTGSCLNK